MEHRVFPGTDLSASLLGMGCMRLPTLNEEGAPIDRPAAIELIRSAIDRGVDYIDTAYGYHGGQSEGLVGEALKDGYRARVTLATKLPVWHVHQYDDMERLLDEQLARLQTDHVDFYLLHALSWQSYEAVRGLGVHKFLDAMQEKGKIRYPAFSFHDGKMAFKKIVKDYPWKMAQVQMNVLDKNNQATLDGVRKYAEGIGIVVMEPLRGGALVNNVPAEVMDLYAAAKVKREPVEWAFRWLYDKPEFTVLLSGMSNMAQLDQNLEIFRDTKANCLSADEKKLMRKVREAYESRVRVGCTGCEYCLPCPVGVNIPGVFRPLDEALMFGREAGYADTYAKLIEKEADGGRCVRCGKCEKACPQKIEIRRHLAEIHREFAR
ncbi:MAG: aldo/keto reductase [Clostridiales bacterium]|nr:aldo/keto reductase [Clostridiales bacterium]